MSKETIIELLNEGTHDDFLNNLAVEAKLMIEASHIGDTKIVLSEDPSGLVLILPKTFTGLAPGTLFRLKTEEINLDLKTTVYEAIQTRSTLESHIMELENLLVIAENKEYGTSTIKALKEKIRDANVVLEKLETKLRETEI